jgi:predicted transposase YdaD
MSQRATEKGLGACWRVKSLYQKDIQGMLPGHDIRQTRIYQELREECLKEAIEKGIEKGIQVERQRVIAKMAAANMLPPAIADLLGLDVELARREMTKNQS